MNRLGPSLAVLASVALASCGTSHRSSTTPNVAPVAGAPNPCSRLTRHALTAAIGSAPQATHAGPTCTYRVGTRGVAVQIVPATAQNRLSLERVPPHAVAVAGPRYHGYVAAVTPINVVGTSQAQVALIAGNTFVTVVLTAPGMSTSLLLRRAAALGHAAAAPRATLAAQPMGK